MNIKNYYVKCRNTKKKNKKKKLKIIYNFFIDKNVMYIL